MLIPGLKYELVCHFKLAAYMVREFVNEVDRPAFFERELMGFDVDGYWCHDHTSRPVFIYMF
jgi:hypothetical protein